MQDFHKLKVWEKAHKVTLEIYRITESFPSEEIHRLGSKMRRAAASIGGSIAEGCGRGTPRAFGRFLQIARGSAGELEYQLVLARDLDLISQKRAGHLIDNVTEVGRMLAVLIVKVGKEATKTSR